MKRKEINAKIKECDTILRKLAFKFTKDPEDIQDLVQETLMRSLKYIDQFLLNPKLISWLYVIMKNVYINQFRRQKQQYAYENFKSYEYYQMGFLEPAINTHQADQFNMGDILKMLYKFPLEHKEMFTKFMDGYKYKELSAHFDIPEGTIKSRIHEIRKCLRKRIPNANH